jgi:hypothetical protein
MVVESEFGKEPWYKCERCGLLLNDYQEAQQHEENCEIKPTIQSH